MTAETGYVENIEAYQNKSLLCSTKRAQDRITFFLHFEAFCCSLKICPLNFFSVRSRWADDEGEKKWEIYISMIVKPVHIKALCMENRWVGWGLKERIVIKVQIIIPHSLAKFLKIKWYSICSWKSLRQHQCSKVWCNSRI